MKKLGTIWTLSVELGLNVEALWEAVANVPVYENPRLNTTFGRFRRKGMRVAGAVVPIRGSEVIELNSRVLTDRKIYRETLGHEIAHAMAPNDGHGDEWRAAARRLGVSTERCASEIEAMAIGIDRDDRRHRIVGRCLSCGFELIRGRKLNPRKIYRHVRCGGRMVAVD